MSLKQEIKDTKKEIRDVKKEISNSRFKSFGRSILAGLSKGVSAVAKIFETLGTHFFSITIPLAAVISSFALGIAGIVDAGVMVGIFVGGFISWSISTFGNHDEDGERDIGPSLEDIWYKQELPTDKLVDKLSAKDVEEILKASDKEKLLSELNDKLDNLKNTYKELKNGNLGLDEAEKLVIEGPKVEQTKASTLKAQKEEHLEEKIDK